MTNNRTVKDEQRFATEGSTERLSGRDADVVLTFLANHDFLCDLPNRPVSANRDSANCCRQIMGWQIMSQQIALWQIATHPFIVPSSMYVKTSLQREHKTDIKQF